MPQEEVEPKRLGRTNSGTVILFDPSSQTIKTEKRKRLDRKCKADYSDMTSVLTPGIAHRTSFKGTAPKVGNNYNIYHEDNSSLLVASLKLDKLGLMARWQRLWGNCNEIYALDWQENQKSTFSMASAA